MPLSAFAARQARKAAQAPYEEVTGHEEADETREAVIQPENEKSQIQDGGRKKRLRKDSHERPTREGHVETRTADNGELNATAAVDQASGSGVDGDEIMDVDIVSDFDELASHLNQSAPAQNGPLHHVAKKICTISSPAVLVDLGEQGYTVSIDIGQSIAFCGIYSLRVDRGVVRIYGATILASPKVYQIFAPSTHCLPLIEHVENPFGVSQPAEVTMLHTVPEIHNLEGLHPHFEYIWAAKPRVEQRSFSFLHKQTDDPLGRTWIPFRAPASWQGALVKLAEAQSAAQRKVLVCGPRGAGKSTFARYLTNALISLPSVSEDANNAGVKFLDLDPGQPEFSVPGELSLSRLRSCTFSPAFTHPMHAAGSDNETLRSHHFGAVSPKKDTQLYLDIARDLYSHSKNRASCPLVINTCGWIQGRGLDILSQLVDLVQPTDVVWLSKTGPAEAVQALAASCQKHGATVHQIDSAPAALTEGGSARTGADLRSMQTMSYFHLDERIEGTHYWRPSRTPLATRPLQTLRYHGAEADIAGVVLYGPAIHPEHLCSVVEGAVLGLVALDDLPLPREIQAPVSNSRRKTRNPPVPYLFHGEAICEPLPPSKTRCLGQVLVASIADGALSVYSPLRLSSISEAARAAGTPLVLVRGSLDVPAWFYTESRHAAKAAKAARLDYVRMRWAEISDAGGSWDSNGVTGPKGEDWTVDADKAIVESDEVSVPPRWTQASRNSGKSARERGDKVWRVRRNLEIKNSGRSTKAK